MLKGQKMSKMALVESVSGQGERNQAELDELYVKTAQMKINHLLEVIERLQDTFSGLGGRSEQLEESVEGKEEELNKMIMTLSAELEASEGKGKDDTETEIEIDKMGEMVAPLFSAKPTTTNPVTVEASQALEEKRLKLMKENDLIALENQVLLEQLELLTSRTSTATAADHATPTPAPKPKDDLQEINDSLAMALKLQTVKKNRLDRLTSLSLTRSYEVANARELAAGAYKERLEGELASMEIALRMAGRDIEAARAAKEAKDWANAMELQQKEGWERERERRRKERICEKEEKAEHNKQKNKCCAPPQKTFLSLAHAHVSLENITRGLAAAIAEGGDVASSVESAERNVGRLVLKLERIEGAEIVTEDEIREVEVEGGRSEEAMKSAAAAMAKKFGGRGMGKGKGKGGSTSERNRSLWGGGTDTKEEDSSSSQLQGVAEEGVSEEEPRLQPLMKRAKSMLPGYAGSANPVNFQAEAEAARAKAMAKAVADPVAAPAAATRSRSTMLAPSSGSASSALNVGNVLSFVLPSSSSSSGIAQFKLTREQQRREVAKAVGELAAEAKNRVSLLEQGL